MFATSTKTATFFPTVTPIWVGRVLPAAQAEAADRPDRRQLPPEHRLGGQPGGSRRARAARSADARFDRRLPLLLAGGALEERVRDAIRIVVGATTRKPIVLT
jgi:hypothetical protein